MHSIYKSHYFNALKRRKAINFTKEPKEDSSRNCTMKIKCGQ